MPGDVQDVVDAAEDPEVAVAVAPGPIAREVDAVPLRPVHLPVPLLVAPYAA
jgi:hypothetical protein